MKIRRLLISTFCFVVLCVIVAGLASCNLITGVRTYYWYDFDETLLHKETLKLGEEPSSYKLPEDTEKWDYVEWRYGKNRNERVAYRIPQYSYFVGNVFQIVIKDLGEQPISTGSAFVFDSDGWFITNAHVMEDAYHAQAIFNIPNSETGESFTYFDINFGTYYHLDKDLYVGRIENYNSIESFYKEIPINLTYEIGENTYSVGYPRSSTELVIGAGKVTETMTSLYDKLYSGNSYVCSSSPIAPGSSGGILTNANLEVIGITTLVSFDENDNFLIGASISAFNFNNLLNSPDEKALISLQERFHNDEAIFIALFNDMMKDEADGLTEKVLLEDGSLAYKFETLDEGVNSDNVNYTSTTNLSVSTTGWISLNTEFYWSNGDRRITEFCGYYDNQKGISNFTYRFEYRYGTGVYYIVKCDNINYSPTIALTLNKCFVDSHSYSFYPSKEEITYSKEQFNLVYEKLTSIILAYDPEHQQSFGEWEIIIEPTCTEKGEKVKYCYCGEAENEIIDALGHSFGEWFEFKNPTEFEFGERRRKCKNCEDYESKIVLKLSHDHSRWGTISIERVEPTCTQTGLTQGTKCSGCGGILVAQEIIPVLGHDYIDHKSQKPTCINAGHNEYQTCSRCDYTNFDVINALGHDYIDHGSREATCLEIGWEAYKTCKICDYTTYEEIASLGHFPGTTVEENRVEATCIQNGFFESVVCCERCNEELLREEKVIEKLGHSLTSSFICSVCDEEVAYYRDGDFLYFGEYPQTIKAHDVTILEEYDNRGYYLGSDGCRYARIIASPSGYDYTFSTGDCVTTGTVYYFKVEPIRWKIISQKGEDTLILCDNIIANMAYNKDYKGEYINSDIRSWLNSTFYYNAFSDLQQDIIKITTVDNSLYSAGYEHSTYANDNTEDKIFILSYRDVVDSKYDFDLGIQTTDYTRASGINMSTSAPNYGNGSWWLRSRYIYRSYWSWCVDYDNSLDYSTIQSNYHGIVPAMWVLI